LLLNTSIYHFNVNPSQLDSQTKCDTGYIRDRHGNTVHPPHA
jgi:hypothetical protein